MCIYGASEKSLAATDAVYNFYIDLCGMLLLHVITTKLLMYCETYVWLFAAVICLHCLMVVSD